MENPTPMSELDQDTTKQLVILAIDDAWRQLRASFNELRSEDLTEAGICGEWSINQVLWHISEWELLLIEALQTPDDGYDYPEPDPDDFNARAISEMKGATPRRVVERLESTHRRLRDTLANTHPSYFGLTHPRRHLIDQWAYHHYEEHATQIAAWRESRRK